MRKKGPGGNYYVRFYDTSRDPSQKEIALGTSRKSIARQKVTEWEQEYEKGAFDPWTDPQPSTLLLTEAIADFLEEKENSVKQSTLDGYQSKLEHFARDFAPGDVLLENVAEKHVRRYVFASGLAQSSKASRFRHVRAFFNWCMKAGHIDRSPTEQIEKPKTGEQKAPFLKPRQVEKLLTTIEAHRKMQEGEPGPTAYDEWLKQMIHVGVGTGLRRGELLNLRWGDVDLEDEMLYVRNRADFTTKNHSEHAVPLRGDALRVLREMQEARTDNLDGPVFTDKNGKPLKEDRVSKRFKFFVCKAKLDGRERISFHTLRHTTASWLAMQGISMRVIQKILGHSSVQVTERYSHLSPEVMGDALEQTFE